MTIADWCTAVHSLAKTKGWYDRPKSPLEVHAMVHSEVSEATDQVARNQPPMYDNGGKPEGEAVELADAVLRIMDYFEYRGWDLERTLRSKHAYNATRPYRHGGKSY